MVSDRPGWVKSQRMRKPGDRSKNKPLLNVHSKILIVVGFGFFLYLLYIRSVTAELGRLAAEAPARSQREHREHRESKQSRRDKSSVRKETNSKERDHKERKASSDADADDPRRESKRDRDKDRGREKDADHSREVVVGAHKAVARALPVPPLPETAASVADESLAEFFPPAPEGPPLPEAQCSIVTNLIKHPVLPNGTILSTEGLAVGKPAYIFRYNRLIRYAHMATAEQIRSVVGATDNIVTAWQAAPAPKMPHNQIRMAVEGLPEQRIWFASSNDGGDTWNRAIKVPTRNTGTSVWSPVLHCDSTGVLWLFYTESVECIRPHVPPTWEPGGDVKVITCANPPDCSGPDSWSAPRTILRQATDGIPKVIANKLVVLSSGEWVLPFWREWPVGESCPSLPALRANDTRTSVGVLISSNRGESWQAHGSISDPRTQLLEPTIVELRSEATATKKGHKEAHAAAAPKLLMLFRTDSGCIFRSYSTNKGKTWTAAEAINVPNPNTKFHMVRLMPGGMLAMVYNNHKRTQECRACRTHLHLALSQDNGDTWVDVAVLEDEIEAGVRIHYPTALQLHQKLLIVYSRFYLGKELGQASTDQGIRAVTVDLRGVRNLPQMKLNRLQAKDDRLLPKNKTEELSFHALQSVIDHFLSEQNQVMLKRYHEGRWHSLVAALESNYDLGEGLPDGKLRKKKKLAEYANEEIKRMLPSAEADSWSADIGEIHRDSRAQGGGGAAEASLAPPQCAMLPCCMDFGSNCLNIDKCKHTLCTETPCCAAGGGAVGGF